MRNFKDFFTPTSVHITNRHARTHTLFTCERTNKRFPHRKDHDDQVASLGCECDFALAVQLISLCVSAKQLLVAVYCDGSRVRCLLGRLSGLQLGVKSGHNEETLHHITATSYIMGKQSRNNSSAFLKESAEVCCPPPHCHESCSLSTEQQVKLANSQSSQFF